MGFFDKLKKINIFSSLAHLGSELNDDFYDELEESLILADTGMDVTLELVAELRRRHLPGRRRRAADHLGRAGRGGHRQAARGGRPRRRGL